jgi:hypothetical protein
MNDDAVLELFEKFAMYERPNRIAAIGAEDDYELNSIQREFEKVNRENMTYEQSSMMIIDNSLINPLAFWYFLPVLAKYVISEGGDFVMLFLQLDQMDKSSLSQEQLASVKKLRSKLKQMDSY